MMTYEPDDLFRHRVESLNEVIRNANVCQIRNTKGAFRYPYLENEDPWGHSVGVKYVAIEKTAYDPDLERKGVDIDPVNSYMDPYPPAYDILMMLHSLG